MGKSNLKIPRICEQCEKPFEAKTVTTRFCNSYCANKSGRERKKQTKEAEEKQTILNKSIDRIADIQTRPYISIKEATILFGISKDTIRRLIIAGKIPAFNLGKRLTRISRLDMEALFNTVSLPKVPKEKSVRMQYETKECYKIGEVSEKFGISPSTVNKTIRRYGIPRRQIGKFVYVPKEQIEKLFV